MSRTVQEIYDSIITEKESLSSLTGLAPVPEDSDNLLTDLTSSSKVAVWRLIFWIISYAIYIHEQLFDSYKEDIEQLSNAVIPATAKWYQKQCLLYQHGDTLLWDGNKYGYTTIDSSLQIVKRAAIRDAGGQLLIKVAKLGGGGLPEKLTAAEKAGFVGYIAKINIAGTLYNVISKDGDLLYIKYNVYYNPDILASDGSLLSDASTFPVEDSINNLIGSLPFDGVLLLSALTDSVQASEGITDCDLTHAQAKSSDAGATYTTIVNRYDTEAGYLVIDPTYPLNTNLTYIPDL